METEIRYIHRRFTALLPPGSLSQASSSWAFVTHRETQPGHYPTFGEFQRFFVSHVAAAVVARVYAHFNELRRRARAFVLHEAR